MPRHRSQPPATERAGSRADDSTRHRGNPPETAGGLAAVRPGFGVSSLPLSRLADRIYAAAPQTGGRRRGEGSVLDNLGIGNLVDGQRRPVLV